MREITLTCPFTGAMFQALEYADGRIILHHPLTGDEIHMNWNPSINKYNIPKSAFKHIPTVTFTEAAEILEVTPQRITQLANNDIIKEHTVANKSVFILDDVLKYKVNRKVGAPKKEKNNGARDN